MITRIAHPTDFLQEGDVAFSHALRLAIEYRCRLDLLHVRFPNANAHWAGFPNVRKTLEHWGLRNAEAPISAIQAQLGITVQGVEIPHRNAVDGISDFLLSHRPELVVLATHGSTGMTRWLTGSVSEGIARQTHIPTLFFGPRPCENSHGS